MISVCAILFRALGIKCISRLLSQATERERSRLKFKLSGLLFFAQALELSREVACEFFHDVQSAFEVDGFIRNTHQHRRQLPCDHDRHDRAVLWKLSTVERVEEGLVRWVLNDVAVIRQRRTSGDSENAGGFERNGVRVVALDREQEL